MFSAEEGIAVLSLSAVFLVLYAYMTMKVVRVTRASAHYNMNRRDFKFFSGRIFEASRNLAFARHKYVLVGSISKKRIVLAGQSLRRLESIEPSLYGNALFSYLVRTILNAQWVGNTLGESWVGDENMLTNLHKNLKEMGNSMVKMDEDAMFKALCAYLFVTVARVPIARDRSSRTLLEREMRSVRLAVSRYLEDLDYDSCDKYLWTFFYRWKDQKSDYLAYAIVLLLSIQFTRIQSWRSRGQRCKEQYRKGITKLMSAFECVQTNWVHEGITAFDSILKCSIQLYFDTQKIQNTLREIPDMRFIPNEVD